jgi:HicB family
MSTLSLRLPVSLHRKLSDLAENEGVSLNQLISSAAAEKVAALMTQEYLLNRASRASRDKFDAVLARVPKVAPVAGDEIPAAYLNRPRRKGGLTNRR